MKKSTIHIQIPEPCHEDWNKMTTTEKVKFCQACTKEVIDFTAKSDEEILRHFSMHESVCGRFHPSQLNRKLIADRKKRNHWLSYAASLLLPITLFSQETTSTPKNTSKTEQLDSLKYTRMDIGSRLRNEKNTSQFITISGTVTDDTKMPLPGATVLVKGTERSKITDFDGNFSIKVTLQDTLVISYVGFTSKEIPIDTHKRAYKVQLLMGEPLIAVTIIGTCFPKYKSKYASTWYPPPMTEEEIKARDERTKNYFAFQRKKWLEKRTKRREKRAARKAKRNEKHN
jgi:hypothetical protein